MKSGPLDGDEPVGLHYDAGLSLSTRHAELCARAAASRQEPLAAGTANDTVGGA